jgi:hypothetical protein
MKADLSPFYISSLSDFPAWAISQIDYGLEFPLCLCMSNAKRKSQSQQLIPLRGVELPRPEGRMGFLSRLK